MTAATMPERGFAPGETVVIRDETWMVLRAERASDGWYVEVAGLGELVRGTEATFSTAIDDVQRLDPAEARVRVDTSPRYRRTRLWLEATMRKSAVPLLDPALTVAKQGLINPLPYQEAAVRKVLDGDNLRPRILLADAVGLGKTIEIGMILSELVRRGRGERMLVVTPKHVLEQMQFELWTRFALPFVRLDSLGIQRIRQQLPATRNPFAYYKRVIISIDTLKSEQYYAHLERHHWDAVVIDESHNVTNQGVQRNRVARLLSRQADALILASATPHNGKRESFAELIRMLEPTAVTADGELVPDEVRRLVVRRHRHSPEVAEWVGADWAERNEPRHRLVKPTPAEQAVADELDRTWLHPAGAPVTTNQLFPWTLAKAFLSSPAALRETVRERRKRATEPAEQAALDRLLVLAEAAVGGGSAKLDALIEELRRIGISSKGKARVVIFAERVATLEWVRAAVGERMRLKDDQVALLHGGLTDREQQDIVESFKSEASPIRVLVTGDVASEGVNLHLQCHELVHYDIPWSLIRIEQRNGRIDRYGQRHSPTITALLLDPATTTFAGDLRVLQRLIAKEHEAHLALGDSASLMGKHEVKAEEEAIRKVLAGEAEFDDVVRDPAAVSGGDDLDALLAGLASGEAQRAAAQASAATHPAAGDDRRPASTLFPSEHRFLYDALEEAFESPAEAPSEDGRSGGVSWREHPSHAIVEFTPSPDLQQRLRVLPQSYLRARQVTEHLRLATEAGRARDSLSDALAEGSRSNWPEAHYLSPLHPALEWAADRALAALGRNEVFAVAAPTGSPAVAPTVLLQASLSNGRGQVVAANVIGVRFSEPDPESFHYLEVFDGLAAALAEYELTGEWINTQALRPDAAEDLSRYVPTAVDAARRHTDQLFSVSKANVLERVEAWIARTEEWERSAEQLAARSELRARREMVAVERGIAAQMEPRQQLVRPLLLIVPVDEGAERA